MLPRRGDQVDQVESEQVGSGVGPEFNQERRGQSRALTFTESPEEEAALVKLQTVLSQDLPDASSTAWYPEVHGEVDRALHEAGQELQRRKTALRKARAPGLQPDAPGLQPDASALQP